MDGGFVGLLRLKWIELKVIYIIVWVKIDFRWYMNYDFFVWYCCLYFWWYCMNKGYIVYGIFIVFLILYVSGIVNVYREGVCWWVIIIV